MALFEQVYELDLEGIVDKDSHAPLTPRIVSKAPGKLRPTLNLTVILGSLPNADRRKSNPGREERRSPNQMPKRVKGRSELIGEAMEAAN